MKIVVFGGSSVQVFEKIYEDGILLGEGLARQGHTVINGGYFGLMGAVSRGAFKENGEVIGVTCQTFTFRDGENPWLTKQIQMHDTMSRLRRMLEMSDLAIAMPGKIGTLNEIIMLMTLWKVYESKIPLFLYSNPFRRIFENFLRDGLIEKADLEKVIFVNDHTDALDKIKNLYTNQ